MLRIVGVTPARGHTALRLNRVVDAAAAGLDVVYHLVLLAQSPFEIDLDEGPLVLASHPDDGRFAEIRGLGGLDAVLIIIEFREGPNALQAVQLAVVVVQVSIEVVYGAVEKLFAFYQRCHLGAILPETRHSGSAE